MSKLFKKIKSLFGKAQKTESTYDKVGINPKKDWFLILLSVFFALVILVVLAVYFYLQINAGNLFKAKVGSSDNEVKINQVLLDKTISDTKRRDDFIKQIKNGEAIPKDPSI
jgi:hypothetical protein